MVPEQPITVRLPNGNRITFSVEEMNHPAFRRGWGLAEDGRGACDEKLPVKIANLAYAANIYDKPIKTSMDVARIHHLFGATVEGLRYPVGFVEDVRREFPHDSKLHEYLGRNAPVVGQLLSEARSREALTPEVILVKIECGQINEMKEQAERVMRIDTLYKTWCALYYEPA